MKFYLYAALRLSNVQPQHEHAELAKMLWTWLIRCGKRHITLEK
jgi:hypothetical protein